MPRKSKPNNTLMPMFLIGGGMVLIIGLLVWQLLTQTPAAVPAPVNNANIPLASIPRVRITDAKAALDAKTAVFVDVRDLDVYQINHINGAVNIPFGEIETRYRELDPNQWIITYCT